MPSVILHGRSSKIFLNQGSCLFLNVISCHFAGSQCKVLLLHHITMKMMGSTHDMWHIARNLRISTFEWCAIYLAWWVSDQLILDYCFVETPGVMFLYLFLSYMLRKTI